MMMMVRRSVQGCLVKSLLLVTSLTSASGTLKQFFIREPDNQTAIEGEQVTSSHSTFKETHKVLKQNIVTLQQLKVQASEQKHSPPSSSTWK